MKEKVSLVLDERNKSIIVDGFSLLKEEYRKRLKIENNKINVLTEGFATYSYVKRQDIYDFVNLLTDYVKRSNIQIILNKNIQSIIQDYQDELNMKKNNIKIAKTIKFLTGDSNFKNNFNLNLLKTEIKQHLSSNYLYYFKIFNNISKTINEVINPEYKLYFQQEMSIYHHIVLGSACNFSVPGAGKTLISLVIFYFLKKQKITNKLLLIAPLSSYISWKDEYLKFIKDSLKEDIFNIEERKLGNDSYPLSDPKKKIIFINYEKIFQNEELLIDFLKKEDVFLVFDEAHKIKNFNAKRTQSAKKLFDYCENKLLLTGTPMPKGYEDLVTYFEAMSSQDLESINFVYKSFNELQNITKNPILHSDKIKEIKKQINPFYIRINKEDLDLGEVKIISWMNFKNDQKHQNIYEIIEKKLIYELKSYKDREKLTEILKARILRLMQVSIDPRMTKTINDDYEIVKQNDKTYNDDESLLTDEKINYKILKNNLPESEEKNQLSYNLWPTRYNFCFQKVDALFKEKKIKKIIIWSCWIFAINSLFEIFYKFYKTNFIYGATEIEKREKYFHDFQKQDGEIKVLICNPASVSESVSLHQYCHDAVYFDMTWNALYYMQSKERIHRYTGEAKINVNYYILINKGSIDEKIWKNIKNKENRMLKTMENKELKPMQESTQSLVDDLFNDYKIKN